MQVPLPPAPASAWGCLGPPATDIERFISLATPAAAAQGAHAAQAGVCSLLLLSQLCAIPKSIPCIIVLVHVTTMYTKPMLYAKNANALQRLCLVGRFGQAKDLHDDIGV